MTSPFTFQVLPVDWLQRTHTYICSPLSIVFTSDTESLQDNLLSVSYVQALLTGETTLAHSVLDATEASLQARRPSLAKIDFHHRSFDSLAVPAPLQVLQDGPSAGGSLELLFCCAKSAVASRARVDTTSKEHPSIFDPPLQKALGQGVLQQSPVRAWHFTSWFNCKRQ